MVWGGVEEVGKRWFWILVIMKNVIYFILIVMKND